MLQDPDLSLLPAILTGHAVDESLLKFHPVKSSSVAKGRSSKQMLQMSRHFW